MFDTDWVKNGHMDAAVKLMETWAKAQPIPGLVVEVVQLEGRTPLIYLEVPATGPDTGEDCVLLYGHLDKQPEMTGWDDDLGPWKPVLQGDRLYGRGGARSEEHTYELQSLMRTTYALSCLKKKKQTTTNNITTSQPHIQQINS